MKYKVVFTEKAKVHMHSAKDWWSYHRSTDEAQRWYVGLSDAIMSLEKNPARCPLARENDSVRYEIRQLNYGLGSKSTHRAIFTIRPALVLVLAIRHLSQRDITAV